MTNKTDLASLNRQVAEALGYFPDRHTRILPQDLHLEWRIFDKHGVGQTDFCESPEAAWKAFTPNYAADLNAMHEAEKALKPVQRWGYGKAIRAEIQHDTGTDSGWPGVTFATAEQRARALLATLNQNTK